METALQAGHASNLASPAGTTPGFPLSPSGPKLIHQPSVRAAESLIHSTL